MLLDENRLRSMTFRRPESIPLSAGILPAAWMQYREALDRIVERHPAIFPRVNKQRNYDAVGGTHVAGKHVDVWGCVWENIHTGMEAIVTGHPVPTRALVHSLRAPEKDENLPHGFMFLRLSYLRGYEELMVDFAEEPSELQILIDKVLTYNMQQLEKRLATAHPGEMLSFGDDLGMQTSLPISPALWRKYLKPCYARLYGRCHAAGHSVYMHTDGHILEIIPDLIECGVNVINPQIRANGLTGLAAACKGRVCVDLDLDRQLFPFASPEQIDAHIEEAVQMLGAPEGGLWLKAEIGPDVSLANIEAIFAAMERCRHYFNAADNTCLRNSSGL